MAEAKRVLVLTPTAEMANAFHAPAEKLALALTLGCGDGTGGLHLDFGTRHTALALVTYAQREPFAGIVAIGDETAPVAARAASMMALPFHTPKAADACRDKRLLARRLEAAGVNIKLEAAFPDQTREEGNASSSNKITLQCLMSNGRLRMLAAVDDGRAVSLAGFDVESRTFMSDALRRTVTALGLKHGPVRVNFLRAETQFLISDVACAYVPGAHAPAFRFAIPLVDQDVSFEELILRNALDLDTSRVLLSEGT